MEFEAHLFDVADDVMGPVKHRKAFDDNTASSNVALEIGVLLEDSKPVLCTVDASKGEQGSRARDRFATDRANKAIGSFRRVEFENEFPSTGQRGVDSCLAVQRRNCRETNKQKTKADLMVNLSRFDSSNEYKKTGPLSRADDGRMCERANISTSLGRIDFGRLESVTWFKFSGSCSRLGGCDSTRIKSMRLFFGSSSSSLGNHICDRGTVVAKQRESRASDSVDVPAGRKRAFARMACPGNRMSTFSWE
jgi:hypothetical protein